MNWSERRRNRNYDTAVYHHDNHYHRKDTRAAHVGSYGGESAGSGFPFQGRAAAFVPMQGEIWETGSMSESRPWTTGSTAGRGGWCVNVATMTTASV